MKYLFMENCQGTTCRHGLTYYEALLNREDFKDHLGLGANRIVGSRLINLNDDCCSKVNEEENN